MSRTSKKHHFVPQAQLRHFAQDPKRSSIWVFDKRTGRAWVSSIQNAGSENDFNTVELGSGKWNFEKLFEEVDGRSAALVSEIIGRRSVGWFGSDERRALVDLFAIQMLRTRFARTTPRYLAGQLREFVREIGYDPDEDPGLAMPTNAKLRLGAVQSFLNRGEIAQSMARLRPALFAARHGQSFILSDDPVALANAFAYGELGLSCHGIIVVLPIAPDLAIALICPTIVARYEVMDRAEMDSARRARMERYRHGFRSGAPIDIEDAELEGWNRRQIARSAQYVYAAVDDFDPLRKILLEHPDLRVVEAHIELGAIGGDPRRTLEMPSGLQLAVQGRHDHCLLPLIEASRADGSLVAKTTSCALLSLVVADREEISVKLYDDGREKCGMTGVMFERIGEHDEGKFRVVHREASIRALMRQLDLR